jgi:hypothetical protein
MTQPTVDSVLAHIGPVGNAARDAADRAREHAQTATAANQAPEPTPPADGDAGGHRGG